jgi:hypothetical protein
MNESQQESQKLTASDTVETPSIHVDPSTGMSWVTLEDYNNLHERLDGVCEEMAKIAVIVGRSKDGTGLDVDWFELADDVKSHREEAPRQKLTGDAAGETTTPRTDAFSNVIAAQGTAKPAWYEFARGLERESSSLKAQLEGFRKDAERYRFIRDYATPSSPGGWAHYVGDWAEVGMDAAIDSALHHDTDR